MTKMKYCGNCKQYVTTTPGPSIIISIFLLILGIVPGIIYIIWASSRAGKCPMCGSKNWSIPLKEEEKKE